MGTNTPIYNLYKPDPTDLVDVTTDLSDNYDLIDAHAHSGTYVALLAAATGVAATDTATVQAALTAVPSTGGLVQGVPGSVYLVNSTLYVKSNTILRDLSIKRADDVTTATVANAANTGATALLVCGPNTTTMYSSGTPGSNIRLEDVTLDGNKAGQTSLPGGITSSNFFAHNFAAKNVSDVTIVNVLSKNSVMSGVYSFDSKRVKITGGKIDTCGDSRLASNINKNGISLTGTAGDGGEAYLVHGVHVVSAIDEGVMYGYAKDVIVSDCHIYSSGKKGIEGDSAASGAGPGNIIVSGNYVRDSGEESIGIANVDAQKVVIADNQLFDSTLSGISYSQASESTLVVTGNTIEGFGGGYSGTPAAYHGVTVTGYKITITGNEIRDGAGSGVSIIAGRLVNVHGNTIENCQASGVIYSGSATPPDLEAFDVHDNVVASTKSHGIRVTTTGAVVKKVSLVGNVLKDIGLTGAGGNPGGIVFDGSGTAMKRVAISDNVVTDERGSPEMGFALNFSGLTNAVTFAKVTDNVLFPGNFRGFEGRDKCAKLIAHGNITGTNGGVFRNLFGSAAPVSGDGAFLVGDFAYNTAPDPAGILGWVCTTAGTPGTWDPVYVNGYDWQIADALTTGEGTYPRHLAVSNAVASTTQNLRLSYFTARKTETITQVRISSGTTAAGATPTLCRIGVWTADAAGALVSQVAAVDSDTALFAGTFTTYTKSFAASFAKVAGQRYAIGVLVVTGAAAPTYNGNSAVSSTDAGVSPRIGGVVTGQADLPASVVAGSVTANGNMPYFVLLP